MEHLIVQQDPIFTYFLFIVWLYMLLPFMIGEAKPLMADQ